MHKILSVIYIYDSVSKINYCAPGYQGLLSYFIPTTPYSVARLYTLQIVEDAIRLMQYQQEQCI